MRSWYVRRLRAMSWGERRLRATRRLRDFRDGRRFARAGAEAVAGAPPAVDAFLSQWIDTPWILTPARLAELAARWPEDWTRRTLGEAEEILAGRYRWLGGAHDLGPRPRWRTETVSGVEIPADHWITLTAGSPTGAYDLKHLWEPNLHGSFVTLAKAYLLTGEDRYQDHLKLLWKDWRDQNPPLCGPNYLAPVEIGLRLMHWGAALRFLAARRAPDAAFLTAIFRDVHFQRFTISDNLSRHSSANNHLLWELASLVLVDTAFPGLAPAKDAERWDEELRREVLLQFHPDGGNREQAFHYHAFSLAFALLVAGLRRRQGHPWPHEVEDRLRAAAGFLDAGLDRRNAPFLYGDSDESEVLPLAEGERHLYLPLLAQARTLFPADGDRGPAAGHLLPRGDERAAWLEGDIAFPGSSASSPHDVPGTAVFPHCGQAWLRSGPLEIHVNAGELGYLSIAAHAHADALSVEVRHDGHPLFIDPGTHSYRGGSAWRERLVSGEAHGSVTVDGREPAERLGPFLWGRRYRARLLARPEGGDGPVSVTAEHDGYADRGVIHRRRVEIISSTALVIEDTLEGTGEHRVRVNWPLGPGRVERTGGGAVLTGAGGEARITLRDLPGAVSIPEGDPTDPGSPCFSPGYDRIEPGRSLLWEGMLTLPARWRTVIEITSDPLRPDSAD